MKMILKKERKAKKEIMTCAKFFRSFAAPSAISGLCSSLSRGKFITTSRNMFFQPRTPLYADVCSRPYEYTHGTQRAAEFRSAL